MEKIVREPGKPDKSTLYISGIVYENDQLQFVPHEEGRIRPVRDAINQVTRFAYDYFLKDHLGNIRMVLTDEQHQDAYPVASLETTTLENEKIYYTIEENSLINKNNVPAYPQEDGYTSPNEFIQSLNGNAQKLGTSMVLKVMSGDRVNIRVSSWYRHNGANFGDPLSSLQEIVTSLAQGLTGMAGGKIGLIDPLQQSTLSSGVAGFLTHQSSQSSPTKPKAYLNWILLNEQLNQVITTDGNNSGFEQVGEDQEFKIHEVTGRELTKNGYLYIYLSNESDIDVFFDNLQVTHVRGPLLEETHYYPFGLEMAGISCRAAGSLTNKFKFGGKELSSNDFSDGSGLEFYDFHARNYDPQIGRWHNNDPAANKLYSYSPYNYTLNNPVLFVDPDGKFPIIPWLIKAGSNAAADMLAQATMSYLFDTNVSSWNQAFEKVNWWQVGRSGVEGLIPWRTPGGIVGRAAGTAVGDVLANAINNPSGYSAEQAGMDFVTGFIGDLAGGGFGEILSRYGSRNVAAGLVSKVGWASKAAHSLTGVWHSATDGNFVGELANTLGNVVHDIDVNYKFSGGSGDVDIITSNFNVEVKSGNKMKLTQSLKNLDYATSQGKGYILYMPKATTAQMNEAAKQGVTIYKTQEELRKALGN